MHARHNSVCVCVREQLGIESNRIYGKSQIPLWWLNCLLKTCSPKLPACRFSSFSQTLSVLQMKRMSPALLCKPSPPVLCFSAFVLSGKQTPPAKSLFLRVWTLDGLRWRITSDDPADAQEVLHFRLLIPMLSPLPQKKCPQAWVCCVRNALVTCK